jgi:hypothetical protein
MSYTTSNAGSSFRSELIHPGARIRPHPPMQPLDRHPLDHLPMDRWPSALCSKSSAWSARAVDGSTSAAKAYRPMRQVYSVDIPKAHQNTADLPGQGCALVPQVVTLPTGLLTRFQSY